MAEIESTKKPRGIYRRGDYFQIDYTVGGRRFRRAVKTTSFEEAAELRDKFSQAENRRKEQARTRRKSIGPFRPTEGWFTAYLAKTRKNAEVRGISFALTLEDIQNVFRAQNSRCAVTGIQFSDDDAPHWRTRPFFPSLDRIDNQLGYTICNVRWVCSATNIALNDFGEGVFRALAFSYTTKYLADQVAPHAP